MCEIRVVAKRDETEELIMENVTKLEVTEGAVILSSLFEGQKVIADTVVASIDFLDGKVLLNPISQG